jgi:hypothetical protein
VRRALAATLLASIAWAGAAGAACRLDPTDRFEPDAVMPQGKFRGACLDTREQRSATLVRARSERGTPVLANVRHAGRYWLCEVRPDAVEDVIFQTEYFPAIVPAAHVELRFRFRDGAEPRLTVQVPGDSAAPLRLRDLVFSVEAVSRLGGGEYDLVKGLFGHFGTAYRMISLEDRYRQMVVEHRHRVKQVRLRLTPRQERDLFAHAVHLADRSGMGVVYNTATRNCATELFRVMDRAVSYPAWRRALAWSVGFLRILPTAAEQALAVRGLLEPQGRGRLPDLDREIPAPGPSSRGRVPIAGGGLTSLAARGVLTPF